MKILLISDSFPPDSSGGAGRIVYNLFNGLQQAGHDVFVITTTQDKNNIKNTNKNIFKIFVKDYNVRWKSYKSLYNLKALKQVKKIILEIQPDIIHFHNVHYYLSYACFKIAKKSKAKTFLTTHDVDLIIPSKMKEFINPKNLNISKKYNYKISSLQQLKRFKRRYNPFRNIIIKHYLKYIDQIFAVSNALKNALEQNNIPARHWLRRQAMAGGKNISVVHNGINADQWQIENSEIENFKNKFNLKNKKIVFFGGRFSGLKGGNQIINIIEQVKKQVPDIALMIMGKLGKESNQILEQAKNKNINLILTDWISGDEKKAAFWSCDVFLTPSYYLDPFPTQNLEAMACKRPVVGTCFGGTQELVLDNQTGFIINPYNIQNTAEKIIKLLKNPELAEKFGQAGFDRVRENFNLDQQVKKIVKYYA